MGYLRCPHAPLCSAPLQALGGLPPGQQLLLSFWVKKAPTVTLQNKKATVSIPADIHVLTYLPAGTPEALLELTGVSGRGREPGPGALSRADPSQAASGGPPCPVSGWHSTGSPSPLSASSELKPECPLTPSLLQSDQAQACPVCLLGISGMAPVSPGSQCSGISRMTLQLPPGPPSPVCSSLPHLY